MMIKSLFSVLFLAVPLSALRASSSEPILTDDRELEGCDKRCSRNNPCEAGGDEVYFEHCKERWFIQCDAAGNCFEQQCPSGTMWSQDFHACVHKECGKCANRCTVENTEEGKFYRRHCTTDTKYQQCDAFGGCTVHDCPEGLIFRNAKQACVYP